MIYKKWGGLLWLTGDNPDEYQFFLIPYIRYKINKRRERLLRKWGKTSYFTKQSISEKWEVEFMSLVPEDDKWHHVSATLIAYVKKHPRKKKIEGSQYIDGTKIADIRLGR